MMMKHLSVLSLTLAICMPASAALRVGSPRCENLVNPLGIDTLQPRLRWLPLSDERGQCQTAYRILVASDQTVLSKDRGDLWDSGKVESDETAHIRYAGKPLAARQAAFWKVRLWDREGKAGPWSEPALWETGITDPAQWQAQWIARNNDIHEKSAPMLRRAFTLDGAVKRARLYVSGPGYHEIRLNGGKVGDHLLDQGYTRYDKRVLYVTHDVTAMLKPGANAIGAMLGNGWQNVQYRNAWDFDKAPWRASPRLVCSLHIELEVGSSLVIGSGPDWKCSPSPITFNVIYGGETYDARLEKAGWDQAGFDDSAWQPAQLVDAPKGRLVAQAMPPIKASQVIEPVAVTEPKPGVFVFDLGVNIAGFPELKVSGPAGTQVAMKMGERLLPDGTVDQKEIAEHVVKYDPSQQFQTDTYILKGSGEERWHSRFTYHGFQYMEVTGLPTKPGPDTLRGVFIHSAVPEAGGFECSNPLLNRIWQATRMAYLGNLHGIPTDCPHREKNGWTGDAHLACEQGLFNYDAVAVYEKWLNDLADERQSTGELPGIVPTGGWGYQWGNGPAWDIAYLLIPHYLHQYQGDTTTIERHYDGMKRYVDYLGTVAKDGIVDIGLPDWAPFETKTPVEVISTNYYHRGARLVSRAAALLGKNDDAESYAKLADSIREAFHRRFYDAETGLYANGSQTSLSCAIYHDLVPASERGRVLDNLVANIEGRNGHIDAGILGSKYILNALSENGRHEIAYRMATRHTLPSWGWWIRQGATTLWENWDGGKSRNHIMFGEISAWFYRHLAGINPDPAAPGFKQIIIKPRPAGDLTAARAHYDSVRGRIVSDWKIADGRFELRVVIPPNTSATAAPGVTFLRMEDGRAVFRVTSGSYAFATDYKP